LDNYSYFILILGMGIVSFIPRWFPLFLLSRRQMPELLVEWLGLIPVSILSALLLPALVQKESQEFLILFPLKWLWLFLHLSLPGTQNHLEGPLSLEWFYTGAWDLFSD